MKRCIAIFGPTASGKSGLALRLAKKLDGVIISADSMQIYRKMNIGTAKPSIDEQKEVPHKLIDICDPEEAFSVYEFKKRAEFAILDAIDHKKTPILVGGTGLYFDALFFNNDFGEMEAKPEIREELEREFALLGGAAMLNMLSEIDPECAAPLHEKDTKRILRGLEVYRTTGIPLSTFKKESRKTKSDFDFLKFFLNYADRENLYQRINLRVDDMIKCGLLEETIALSSSGVFSSPTAAQAIGYKELIPHLTYGLPLDVCIENLKRKTRNYAKRQLTWFRRYHDAIEILMDRDPDPLQTMMTEISEWM